MKELNELESEKLQYDYMADILFTSVALIVAKQSLDFLKSASKYSDYLLEKVRNPAAVDTNDPREALSRNLVLKGYASVDEILEASYGVWPPNGLDIATSNPQHVRIKPSYEPDVYGSASTAGERVIRLNDLLLNYLPGFVGKSAYYSTLGHEGIHILQGDNFDRAFEIYDPKYVGHISSTQMVSGQYDSLSNIFEQNTNHYFSHSSYFNYVKSGLETQARIHQILIDGYQKWKVLPVNKEELIIALRNSGVVVPEEIMTDIRQSDTYEKSSKKFGKVFNVRDTIVSDINFIQDGLTRGGKLEFWNNGIPRLYSDLIEMYGDNLGRQRFGLGENPRPRMRLNEAELTTKQYTPSFRVGGSVAGLGLGAIGLKNALERDDNTGIAVSGADIAVSSADLILDTATAFGKTVSPYLHTLATRANIAVTIADGIYQVSQEEEFEHKVARAGAVTATAGSAVAVGSIVISVAGTGLLATFATVAAPITAAVAVGYFANESVDAYKDQENFNQKLEEAEKASVFDGSMAEDGLPSMWGYEKLSAFLISHGISLKAEDIEPQDHQSKLDIIEGLLLDHIDNLDILIEENDSWDFDWSRALYDQEGLDAKREAMMDRAPLVAALKDLNQYRHNYKMALEATKTEPALLHSFDFALYNQDPVRVSSNSDIGALMFEQQSLIQNTARASNIGM